MNPKEEKKKIRDSELKPMSMESFNAMIDESEKDAENGRVIDAHTVKKQLKKWK